MLRYSWDVLWRADITHSYRFVCVRVEYIHMYKPVYETIED